MHALTVQFRGQLVTGGARRMPDRVDAPGNRYYRIETACDFLMRFSRELWDFLQDTNLVPRRCAQIALGCRSDIAVFVHESILSQSGGQRQRGMAEDSFRLVPKATAASQPLRRSPEEPATPASRRRFAARTSEKPPPWGGGLRCRWTILEHRARAKDRFAAATMLARGARKAVGNDLHASRIRPRHRHNLGPVHRDRTRLRGSHRQNPPSRRANLPTRMRSQGRAVEPGTAASAPSPPSTAPAAARRSTVLGRIASIAQLVRLGSGDEARSLRVPEAHVRGRDAVSA